VTSLLNDRIDLKFYKLWEAGESTLKDASSRQTSSSQIVVFIKDSYKNELVALLGAFMFFTQLGFESGNR
jgi:hypothetical protein